MKADSGLYDRLARLLAYHENAAETVRAQLRVLGRGATDRAPVRGLGATVRDSSARHARDRETDRRADKPRGLSRAVVTRRGQTASVLAQFDPQVPKRPEELPVAVTGLGALVRRGYLEAKGSGYIRTDKPFYVHPQHG